MEQEIVKQKSGSFVLPIIIGILLTIMIVAALLIKFDVAGIGSTVAPILKDVPVIKLILPEMTEEAMADLTDEYQNSTIEEVIERLKATEKLLKEKEIEVETLTEKNEVMTAEIERLKVFENDKIQFDADKEAFDRLVVFSDKSLDSSEFMKFYESISPDNAAALYTEAVQKQEYNKEIVEYAQTFANMKAEQAAKIIEEMTSNMDLVVLILNNINSEQRADILGEMDPKNAAKISKYMVPES